MNANPTTRLILLRTDAGLRCSVQKDQWPLEWSMRAPRTTGTKMEDTMTPCLEFSGKTATYLPKIEYRKYYLGTLMGGSAMAMEGFLVTGVRPTSMAKDLRISPIK